ncbi:alpha/beta hydrolase domain-containing protein [Alteromonas lipolytica]|uniref:Alpha/beta hydrolase domain-containing protein n=1 Tax=Alteromonas lipolytica TaxID=1856405 RepID=A0A1E8FI56_9ALTE|nr:alpha/beta hydrolase domain-containing protein [Alteromonas lipolytica]OFI35611.1 hypothetical protein BFC17_12710 [Alteromonas lipolytica]GGF77573.1 hypothetical protein GCM10011338_32440 [Alteromonas lipolytica]
MASPKITGPVSGGKRGYPFSSYMGDLDKRGYVEEEFFIEGKATTYKVDGELGFDGKWQLAPDSQKDYRTRILVRRPKNAADFNGVVLVEWLNVTLGHDIEVTGAMSNAIYDAGCVYVMASCQRVGVVGAGDNKQGLHQWDPERYGSLDISGDSLSFDILTQVGRAVGPKREFTGKDPLNGLKPVTILATGASQSAGRLRGYINGVHPLVNVYHGFLPTIDFGMSFGFDDFDLSSPTDGAARVRFIPTIIRSDIKTPVIVVNSETESLMYFRSRQPDSRYFRYWEVAGASHAPAPYAKVLDAMRERDGLSGADPNYGSFVPWRPVSDVALIDLIAWAQKGTLPPEADKIEVVIGEKKMPEVVRDELGNAKGGIRLPEITVPTATHTAAILGFASPLGLRGKSEPFDKAQLQQLYPTRKDYVTKVTSAAKQAAKQGFILESQVERYIEKAQKQPLGL